MTSLNLSFCDHTSVHVPTNYSELASALVNRTNLFDRMSVSIMAFFAVRYASPGRPTVNLLYRSYCAELRARNVQRCWKGQPEIPTLSKYIFRSMIEMLDPNFVLLKRYGAKAANGCRRGGTPRAVSMHQSL